MRSALSILTMLVYINMTTADGAVIVQEAHFVSTQIFSTLSFGGGSQAFSQGSGRLMNQFDPNLGELTAVNISYSFSSTHSFKFENISDSDFSFESDIRSRIQPAIEAPSEMSVVYFSWQDYSVDQTNQTGFIELATGQSFSLDKSLTLNFENSYTSPSALLAFTGDSTFLVGLSALSAYEITSLLTIDQLRTTRGAAIDSGFVSVEFVYNAVPEPASALLLGLGGLGFLIRRRTK